MQAWWKSTFKLKCSRKFWDLFSHRLLSKNRDVALRGNLQFFSKDPLIELGPNTKVEREFSAVE